SHGDSPPSMSGFSYTDSHSKPISPRCLPINGTRVVYFPISGSYVGLNIRSHGPVTPSCPELGQDGTPLCLPYGALRTPLVAVHGMEEHSEGEMKRAKD